MVPSIRHRQCPSLRADRGTTHPRSTYDLAMTDSWRALQAAHACDVPRVPWHVGGLAVGSVARAHLDALRQWPQWLAVEEQHVTLLATPDARDTALALINRRLHAMGLIVAWRDETYAVVAAPGAAPLALIERAASRFWGTLTFGAHCNGYVADATDRPAQLWIARRAAHKPTDPGKLDNLVGGGVPHGQTPFEALLREGHEEAGLPEAIMRRAQAASVIGLRCDIAEGFMREDLHTFDLALAPDLEPQNQDGEVQALYRMPVAEAIECAAAGEMTVDAALVTLDFALRWRLLPAVQHAELATRLAPIRRGA